MSCIELMNRTENISPWVIRLNKALWLQKHDALKQEEVFASHGAGNLENL